MTPRLLHELIEYSARQYGARDALVTTEGQTLDYATLASQVRAFAQGVCALGLQRQQRVALYLDKRPEMVVAAFGTAAAGGVFVPINPLLKPEQVAYILQDCAVSLLVTTPERLRLLAPVLAGCPALQHLIIVGEHTEVSCPQAQSTWATLLASAPVPCHRVIDSDMVAILYTSGSTGRPKGVVLSHRNMVTGAHSVADYLGNHPDDTLLAALPLSFDAGFSQLTTAFASGARVVLLNYLLPRDVLKAVTRFRVTGLTAVPPLWIQLAGLNWPAGTDSHLRYIANTGGRMPAAVLTRLREQLPATRPFLMYGLTEAFRATYLPPEEVDRRPDSMGKAIPNSEILVLRPDGSLCDDDEPGELVQRGPLVAMGYWNDPAKTAERFRPLPASLRPSGLMLDETVVYSGDTVRRDREGFLYFIGRQDEMIKTSGYRVSPNEIEEACYATGLVGEVAAFGIEHASLGQVIAVVAQPARPDVLDSELLAALRPQLPGYMLPSHIRWQHSALPRNPNGKIDRKALASAFSSQ